MIDSNTFLPPALWASRIPLCTVFQQLWQILPSLYSKSKLFFLPSLLGSLWPCISTCPDAFESFVFLYYIPAWFIHKLGNWVTIWILNKNTLIQIANLTLWYPMRYSFYVGTIFLCLNYLECLDSSANSYST